MIKHFTKDAVKGNIVLIHGMCHGAFCWPFEFIQPFLNAGYNVFVLDLPGHEQGGKHKSVNRFGIDDYVEAVRSTTNIMKEPVWLMGHSMGGFVIQKFLERYPCTGAILLAPVPYFGMLPAALRYLVKHPIALYYLLTQDIYKPFVAHASDLYYHIPESNKFKAIRNQMRSESFKALLHMMFKRIKRPAQCPILVVAAQHDQVITMHETYKTSAFHKATHILRPNNGHNLMLEPENEQLAHLIIEWVFEKSL